MITCTILFMIYMYLRSRIKEKYARIREAVKTRNLSCVERRKAS